MLKLSTRFTLEMSFKGNQAGFERYGRKSRWEQLLEAMESVVAWGELEALIELHCPRARNERRLVGLSIMLPTYSLQQWFSLGRGRCLYESPTLRRFAGVDLGRAAAPDETTILRFRLLL